MPTYAYACTECGHEFDAVQSFSEDSLTGCPVCEGRLRKKFGAVGVVFKGSGFYRNDSRNGSGGGDKTGGDKTGGDKTGGDKTGGDKSSTSEGSGTTKAEPAAASGSTSVSSSSGASGSKSTSGSSSSGTSAA